MSSRHLIAACAAVLTLFLAISTVQAEPARDRVDVVVVYDAIPGELERARTAALGARINCEFDNLPMRALSIPAHMLDAVRQGKGVRSVEFDSAVTACPTLAGK